MTRKHIDKYFDSITRKFFLLNKQASELKKDRKVMENCMVNNMERTWRDMQKKAEDRSFGMSWLKPNDPLGNKKKKEEVG